MKPRVIVFDLDGVIFDTIKLVNDFFSTTYPGIAKDIVDEMLTGNFHEELAKIKLLHEPLKETKEEYRAREDQYAIDKSKSPLYPGMKDFLSRLHEKKYILTINTSASEKNCIPLLKHSGIESLFDFVATKNISISKVIKFQLIADRYKCSKDELIFITDTLGDIREADTASVRTFAVTWGAHDRSFFTREPHKYLVGVVDSVSELSKAIDSL